MERNRSGFSRFLPFSSTCPDLSLPTVAAQASRDRKKNQTEILGARVAELEEQLATSTPSSSAASAYSPFIAALPALPPTFSALAPTPDPESLQLREENETLKTQLALEKLQSQSLQIRLAALESKFGRLEQLLSGGMAASATPAEQLQSSQGQPAGEQKKMEMSDSTSTEQDSLRLVAREVDSSLQRKLSYPSSSTPRLFPSTLSPRPRPSTSTLTCPPSPPAPSPSVSTSTSAPSRPTLHQILSSITITPLSAGSLPPRTTSFRHGTTGRATSTSLASLSRNRPSTSTRRRARSSTCSSSCVKTSALGRRLKLFVRR
jgi:hypothetical protein